MRKQKYKVTIIVKEVEEGSCKGCIFKHDLCSGFTGEIMMALGLPHCVDNNIVYIIKGNRRNKE